MDEVIEEIIYKKVNRTGNSAHIIVPKRHDGKKVVILVLSSDKRPYIHRDRVKMIDGKKHFHCEITDGAGTHGFWISEEKVEQTLFRN